MKHITYIFATLLCVLSFDGKAAGAAGSGDIDTETGAAAVSRPLGTNFIITYTDGTEQTLPIERGIEGVTSIHVPVDVTQDEVEPGAIDKIAKEIARGLERFSKETDRTADKVSAFFSGLASEIKDAVEKGKIEREAKRLESQAREAAKKAEREVRRVRDQLKKKIRW